MIATFPDYSWVTLAEYGLVHRMGQRQLRAEDGHTFGVYEALPREEPKGGVVVIQEIFGVNAHIREVADGYASDGYAALAPALFDRVERTVELGYDAVGMDRGRKLAFSGLSREDALRDLQATVEEAGKYGQVGVVGYCFGGLMAWLAACRLEGIACVSAYYGGGIAAESDATPKCPVVMHFGELDAHIPMTDVERIRRAQPAVPVHTYPADHGFNCDHRQSFHAASAAKARERTAVLFRDAIR